MPVIGSNSDAWAAGSLLVWAGSRCVQILLFEVVPFDVRTITAAVVTMVTVASAPAICRPGARRA